MKNEDCIAIQRLLESGFSLRDTLNVLKDKTNQIAFDSILTRLRDGEDLNSFFHLYCPKQYRSLFESFIQCMPFLESLTTCIEIVEAQQKNKKEIIQGMFYPVMLFVGMLVGVYLFNEFILPNMISLLAGFQLKSNQYVNMQIIIKYLIRILMILSSILMIIVFGMLQKNHIVSTYQFISQYFPNTILVQSISSKFARFFLECQKRNISTKDTLRMLCGLTQQPCISYIAKEIDEHLMNGETMMEAVKQTRMEETLLRFFRIAILSSSCEEMLEGYLKMVQIRKEQAIKRFSRYIQLFSYSLIGFVMIFVYQILMLPMSMLQNL